MLTVTDNLTYEIETTDVYKDSQEDKDRFDVSNYDKNSEKKVSRQKNKWSSAKWKMKLDIYNCWVCCVNI